MQHEERLKRIQEKLQQMLKQLNLLQKENSQLTEALQMANTKNEEQQKNIDTLKQQVSILKLGTGQMNEVDKKEFEKRINTYIKEIDRAIASLSA